MEAKRYTFSRLNLLHTYINMTRNISAINHRSWNYLSQRSLVKSQSSLREICIPHHGEWGGSGRFPLPAATWIRDLIGCPSRWDCIDPRFIHFEGERPEQEEEEEEEGDELTSMATSDQLIFSSVGILCQTDVQCRFKCSDLDYVWFDACGCIGRERHPMRVIVFVFIKFIYIAVHWYA